MKTVLARLLAAFLALGCGSAPALATPQWTPPPPGAATSVAPGAALDAGTALGRSLSARAQDLVNVKDGQSGAKGDGSTDDTAALQAAISTALASSTPAKPYLPCGTYILSGTLAVTTAANQGVLIQGENASCVTLKQTADADAITVNLTNYGGVFGTGAVKVAGLKIQMAAAGSTSRKAISIVSTAASGAAGVPVILDDLNITSASATSYWGYGVYLSQIPDAVYVSRVNGYYPSQITGGTHISINGVAGAYTTSVFVRDTFLVNGLRGIELGSYLQGIHLDNINTIGTAYALRHAPTGGINVELQVANSYLDGKTVVTSTGGGSIGELSVAHTVFDALNGVSAGETNVAITGVTTLKLIGNTFTGSTTVANITGLSIAGSNVTPASLIGNSFTGYANGGTALNLSNTTYSITLVGNQFASNATNLVESGVANFWSNTVADNALYSVGNPLRDGLQIVPSAAGAVGANAGVTNLSAFGADANIGVILAAKGLPSSDFYLRDGLGRDILQLQDSQNASSGIGANLKQGTSTVSTQFTARAGANLLLGASGSQATATATGLMQIPYMAGAPTGTPATTGGATMVFDTTNLKLWIYSPTASAWKSITLQ